MTLFNKFNIYKNSIALISDDISFTYNDIIKEISKFKKFIDKKSLVLLIASNKFMSIIFYIFSIRYNCKIIILDENHSYDFIKDTIKKFKPNFIFFPTQKKILLNEKKIIFDNYALVELKRIIDKKINNKNSIILTTSGTTSNPKFVRISNQNIFKNTYQIQKYLKINKNHKTITTLPMAYSYGLSVINTHLEFGACIYLNNIAPVNRKFWEIIKKENINSFSLIPQLCDYLKKLKFEKLISNNLQYLTVAGGKTDIETLKYIKKICKSHKINFFVMYGQTEASPRISYLDITKTYKIDSIGKPLEGGKIKIINKEIVYYGKNVSLGYAQDIKDLYLGDVNKGKLNTGDLGKKDSRGFFYIVGRKKRISKLFGLRIDLNDIQSFLQIKGFEVLLKINDKKIDIYCNQKYDEMKIKEQIFQKYNINKHFISCKYEKKTKKNIFK